MAHHLWCNSSMPEALCLQCPALWEKYPYTSAAEAATLSIRHFPHAVPVVDYILEADIELEELRGTLELIRAADMRAIMRWQAAGPGRQLTWPDRTELIVWLLERLA